MVSSGVGIIDLGGVLESRFSGYQIAKDVIEQKKSFLFPKVSVIDFPLQTAGINALSSFLADDLLSHSLEQSTLFG